MRRSNGIADRTPSLRRRVRGHHGFGARRRRQTITPPPVMTARSARTPSATTTGGVPGSVESASDAAPMTVSTVVAVEEVVVGAPTSAAGVVVGVGVGVTAVVGAAARVVEVLCAVVAGAVVVGAVVDAGVAAVVVGSGGGGASVCTTTVPDIPAPPLPPWILQKYGYVPGEVKVCENGVAVAFEQAVTLDPLHCGCESKDPSSPVTECGAVAPANSQVTASPVRIVTCFGSYELLTTLTVDVAAWARVHVQPARTTAARTLTTPQRARSNDDPHTSARRVYGPRRGRVTGSPSARVGGRRCRARPCREAPKAMVLVPRCLRVADRGLGRRRSSRY